VRHEITAEVPTYWIAYGPGIANGFLDVGQSLATGEETLETFTKYMPYLNRWVELGHDPQDAPPRS
jgi:hypothetical protein